MDELTGAVPASYGRAEGLTDVGKRYGNYSRQFKLGFDYLKYDEDGNVEATQRAVNDVNLDIEAGDFCGRSGGTMVPENPHWRSR